MISKFRSARKKAAKSTPWLSGDGEMTRLVKEKDWSKTSLGPIEKWPSSLQTTLGVVLRNRFAMMIWWGPELINFYNDAYRPILRDKHPASLGAPAAELWAEIWDFAGPLAEGIMKGGPATWMEDVQLFIKSGELSEETYFTFSYSPIPDNEGNVGGLLNTVQETTIKVQSERQIQMLHELAATASKAKSASESYEITMRVLSANELDIPFAFLFTRNDENMHLVGKVGWKNYNGPANDPTNWPLEKSIDSTELVVKNLTKKFGKVPSGQWGASPNQAIIIPLKRSEESTPGAYLVAGISPHRKFDDRYKRFFHATADQIITVIGNSRAYEEEKKRAEGLAELDRAKTAFFTSISHEFRTPLTLMLSPLEESFARTDLPKDHIDELVLIHRNTLRLQRLVNTLLDFSAVESGKLKSTFQPIEISNYTKELASSFQSAMDNAGLKFEIDCQTINQKIYIDYKQWETIILNLLSNALKYTLKGSVKLSLHDHDKYIELAVKDSGAGIAKSELPHMFERFHRVQGVQSRSIEGSGIGLALVNELVKLHGGSISVQSEFGVGSKFKVRIKKGKSHLPKNQIIEIQASHEQTSMTSKAFMNEARSWTNENLDSISTEESGGKRVKSRLDETILVVDDNPDMLGYIKKILDTNTSLAIKTANSGQKALQEIKKKQPSLIITDIMMPKMDGFQLVSAIRENQKNINIPIIFLSARAGERERVEGIAEGVDGYITKPFSVNELVATVNTHLNLVTQRKKLQDEETNILHELNSAKDEFISIVSHQLRTPASSVKQYLAMLMNDDLEGKFTKQQVAALNHAYNSNERQLKIIDGLLKVAQIDAGKVKPKKALTDLAKLTEEVLNEQRFKIYSKKQTLTFDPPKKSTNADVDPRLIRMVVENLLDNASKYTPQGKNIDVSLNQNETDVILAIKDEGVGIDKDDIPKLFKKFSRIENENLLSVDGNGLGLYWAKKIVEAHGGSVEVDSKPHQGSSFRIKLPVAKKP